MRLTAWLFAIQKDSKENNSAYKQIQEASFGAIVFCFVFLILYCSNKSE